MLGKLKFWDGNDPTARLIDGKPTSREDILAALAPTRFQMQQAPQEPYWTFHMGELYSAVDSTTQAVEHLNRALEIDAAYAPAAALLSKIYYVSENLEAGVNLLDGFISRNTTAPDALRAALALHLEALGDIEQAQSMLNSASTDTKEVRAARTFVSLRGSDLDNVLGTAKQTLEEDSRSAANHNNYGIALLIAGRPDAARRSFKTALKFNDRLPGALYNLAIVETFYFFDKDAGREWFSRYKQYASDDPDDLASHFSADVSKRSNAETSE